MEYVCDICGDTGRGKPTLQNPDGEEYGCQCAEYMRNKIQKQKEKDDLIDAECKRLIDLFYPHTYTAANKPYSYIDAILCARKCANILRREGSINSGHLGRLGLTDNEYWGFVYQRLSGTLGLNQGTIVRKDEE